MKIKKVFLILALLGLISTITVANQKEPGSVKPISISNQ